MSTSAIVAMPSVVPRPSSNTSPMSSRSVAVLIAMSPCVRPPNTSIVPMMTTLLNAGANAAATNRRRAFSNAVSNAVNA
jgi:hypothetical protein